MPLMDFDLQATWDACYNPPFTLENREAIYGAGMRDAHALRQACEAIGMLPSHKIIIIGAGFGWLAKAWFDAGYTQIVACDTSGWINQSDRKAQNATFTIMNEGGMTTASKRNIRNALGLSGNAKANFLITEDVLPCLSDSEIQAYAPHARDIAQTVVHWVTPQMPGNYAGLNWKPAADWKALMSPDYIVARGTNVAV